MKKVRQVVIHKHIKNCWADQKYGGEWVTQAARYEYRDKLGRKNPKAMTRFIVFRCNDASCPAEMIVAENEMIEACGISTRRLRGEGHGKS